MLLENMTPQQRKQVARIAKEISGKSKGKSNIRIEEIMPPKDLQKADEAYIIELFSITEDQVAEIKQLKAKIAAQDRLIEKMQKKMQAAGIDAEGLPVLE